MDSWFFVAGAAAAAVLMAALLGWRLRRDLSRPNFAIAVGYLGAALVFGYIAWLIKGFSTTSFLALVAFGYLVLLVATWGRPGRMFEIWLKESTLTRRQSFWFQFRLIAVILLAVAISIPLWVRIV
jgi:hypothetical protein